MGISVVGKNVRGKVPTWRSFIADTEEDINILPIFPSVAYGSECFCTDNGNVYILEVNNNWVLKKESAAGSSLPEVTDADNGKVLAVVNGEWNKAIPAHFADLVLHATATPEYGEEDEIIGITVEVDMTPAEFYDIKNDSDTIVMILNYDEGSTYLLTFDGNIEFDGLLVMSNISSNSPNITGIKVVSLEGEWRAEMKTGQIDVTWDNN